MTLEDAVLLVREVAQQCPEVRQVFGTETPSRHYTVEVVCRWGPQDYGQVSLPVEILPEDATALLGVLQKAIAQKRRRYLGNARVSRRPPPTSP